MPGNKVAYSLSPSLSLAPSLSPSLSVDASARTPAHAHAHSPVGRMSSHFVHEESARWSIIPRYIPTKDVDLPTENMSRKISIIHPPEFKPAVKPLIMSFILSKKKKKNTPSLKCQVPSAFPVHS